MFGIDIHNGCEMWSIGGGGYGGFSELAWDDYTYALYGISDDFFFEIDPETGEVDYIGNIDVSLSQIEFDNSDTLYGFNFPDTKKMYTIDIFTLEATFVCNLTNITNGYYSVAFDKDTNNLYLLGNGHLYICDTETYKCTLIGGNMSSGIEGFSFVIPYGGIDDTSPPITTHTLNPPEPDGNNGWYISDVNVTLTATDDLSGVKEIRYWVNGGSEQVIPGDNGSFILDEDCWNGIIEYWAIDNAGNVETPKNSFTIYIDQTVPDISITYEHEYFPYYGWTVVFTVTATDAMSGMDYVEFYDGGVVQETVYGPGPEYEWIWNCANLTHIIGLIRKPVVSESNVSFYSITVITIEDDWDKFKYFGATAYDNAGNSESDEILSHFYYPPFFKLLQFQNLTLPNNYRGYIGRNFIFARFNTSQVN